MALNKVLSILTALMLAMVVALVLKSATTLPGLGLVLAPVVAFTALGFIPLLLLWALTQRDDTIPQTVRFQFAAVAIMNALFAGFIYYCTLSDRFANVLVFIRIGAVLAFIMLLPWLAKRMDENGVRWFIGASMLFYAASTV